jgi:hypothetical protein
LPGHSNSDVPKSSLFNENTVYTIQLRERARPGPSLPLSVSLLSSEKDERKKRKDNS